MGFTGKMEVISSLQAMSRVRTRREVKLSASPNAAAVTLAYGGAES
jgi:hypothetical protein